MEKNVKLQVQSDRSSELGIHNSTETTETTRSSTNKTMTSERITYTDVCGGSGSNSNVADDSESISSEMTVEAQSILGTSEVTESIITQKKCALYKTMKRKRSQVKLLPRANNSESYEASWSELDKQRLLIALQRFGTMEIDNILKAVPGKSEEDIKKYIKLKWKLARVELRTHLKEVRKSKGVNSRYLGPIDKWLEVLNKTFPNFDHYKANPLAHAVLLIWKYEKHPEPAECGGVDFKAMYEYLYCMLCGYPPKHLNQPTATHLAESLKNFACGIKYTNWLEVMKFLDSPLTIHTSSKNSDVKEEDIISAMSYTKEQCLDELLKVPGFNPFCVPRDLLKRKVPVPFEEPEKSSAPAPIQESIETTAPARHQSSEINASASHQKSSEVTTLTLIPESSENTTLTLISQSSEATTLMLIPESSEATTLMLIPESSDASTLTLIPESSEGTLTLIPESSEANLTLIPESSEATTLTFIPEQVQVTAPVSSPEQIKAAPVSSEEPTTVSEPILEPTRTTKPLRTYSKASKKILSASTHTRT